MLGATTAALRSPSRWISLLLFAATAAFVVWRNTQVGVLVDISYILNTATRIAAGDVPYSGFPLAQAPFEFLAQAALIRLFGPHFSVQIAYAAVVGGTGTALAYAIARRILAKKTGADLLAAVLAVPLIPLGAYSIYPHPMYDPDACVAVLAATLLVLVARDGGGRGQYVRAGALAAAPVFIKQNIGGAFLLLLAAALAMDAVADRRRRAGALWWATGAVATLAIEITAVQLVAGVGSYLHWTWTYALSARGLTLARAGSFADPRLVWPALLILVPALAAPKLHERARAAAFVGALCVPAALGIARPGVWLSVPETIPSLVIAASVLALAATVAGRLTLETWLPLVMGGTIVAALQSQGLYASSFGIFPMLAVTIACVVREIALRAPQPARLAPISGIVISLILAVWGSAYTVANTALRFIDVDAAGQVQHSAFPSLGGLSARGSYLGDLDRLLFWIQDNVPPDAPMAVLPGEDPVFFALGRRPSLPSVYFFNVASPLPPVETARAADRVGLRWVFVKDRLQLVDEPPTEQELVARLTEGAQLVTVVGPYRVYRR